VRLPPVPVRRQAENEADWDTPEEGDDYVGYINNCWCGENHWLSDYGDFDLARRIMERWGVYFI
jgi:hypothetical protein